MMSGGEKLLLQSRSQLVLQQAAHQELAEHRAAPLIAQYEAQGGYVRPDFRAIVVARVAARPQDAGDARVVSAQGPCRAQHVRPHLHVVRLREGLSQGVPHPFRLCGDAPRAVEADGLRAQAVQLPCNASCRAAQFFVCLIHRVDAFRLYLPEDASVFRYAPVCLGGAAVCNQYHLAVFSD